MLFHRSHPYPLLWVMLMRLFSCYSVSVEPWQERQSGSQSQIYLLPDPLLNKCAYLCSRMFIDHILPIHFCSEGCRASHPLPNILKSTKTNTVRSIPPWTWVRLSLGHTLRTGMWDHSGVSIPNSWLPSKVTQAHTAMATLSIQPLTLLRCLLLSRFIDIK